MRVCVTGGTGFLGRALVRRLLAEGLQVRVLARPSQRADELEARGVEVVRGDLNDRTAIEQAVSGAQVAYHVAAKIEGGGRRKEFMETNVGGTQSVFEACLRKGVPHVVYLSSIAVYGLAREGECINEDTPYDGASGERDAYSQSKIEADEYAVTIGRKTKLTVTILRPGVVYGPGRHLPVALLGFGTEKTNVVFGRRAQRFPLIYVENLVDAIELVGRRTDGGLKKYVVLDDDNLTLGEYHATLAEVGRMRALFFPGWPVLVTAIGVQIVASLLRGSGASGWLRQVRRALQNRWYDTRRLREETGWAPKVPLREAIQRTLTASG